MAECIVCGAATRPEAYESELPNRAAALRSEAARFADMAARCEADAAAVDAQIEALAATGGHPAVCVAGDHYGVPGSGCQRFITDRDLLARWPGGGLPRTRAEPGVDAEIEELVEHITANQAAGRATAGMGHRHVR